MNRGIFDLKTYILDNGLKLVTIKKDTQLAAIHVGVKIGSIYEKKEEKGIAHFVEHMMFKGTKNRDNEELNEELEQRAGEYNAYTDYDCTVYSITALNDEVEESLKLLSDMLINSTFPEEEIEKERGVILAEIRTGKDDIEDYSYRKTMENAFKNSSIKIDTIGKESTVKSFTRERLFNFYKTYYVPNNTYISIVSPQEHDDIFNLVNKYFSHWKRGEFVRENVIVEDNIPTKIVSYKKDIEQSTIVYLYTFHNLSKQEELALRILNYKLGESANSILFRKLREERGLAYDIYSDLNTTKSVKLMSIYTAVNEEDVKEALKIINNIIYDINNEIIVLDNNNINLMKKVLKTAVAGTLEDSTQLSNYILHQIIDEEDVYEFVDDINNMEKIKSEDIYKVARKVLKNPTVHILLREKSGR
ncbi:MULTISPECIES: M16 family metallopeptidase [Clostridium]|uniref:Putative zinc protease AlbF n=2 Tax=Clostridium TaxID=1485 RepID=A0A151ARM5_9CLOT|nr:MULTISPECIES: pitrilysin family protein [Clostridium]KYH30242.1 putative zinc protease AlbF [Clostridium colicanis DSM 13634]PRR69356.1 putative zinc protease AlbF [Clostridium thermopalmarium DSM 5974]PVZ26378.1 putative Zn-dependent peptidase [Clostridium thermopalmarium DSM 5974]